MKVNLKITSLYDKVLGKAGYIMEANPIIDGKILNVKTLKFKEDIFSSSSKEDIDSFFQDGLDLFIEDLNNKFDIDELNIEYRKNAPDSEIIKNMQNDNIHIKENFDPKAFQANSAKIFSNMMLNKNGQNSFENAEKNKIISNNKRKRDSNFRGNVNNKTLRKEILEEQKQLSQLKNLDSFIEKFSHQNDKQEKNFINNIKNVDKIFIDFSFILKPERKRYGFVIQLYDTYGKTLASDRPIHKFQIVANGERSKFLKEFKQKLYRISKALKEQNKEIIINVPNILRNNNEFKNGIFNPIQNLFEGYEKFSLCRQKTNLHNKEIPKVESIINANIDMHLKALKDPNNVAVFIDGSINEEMKTAGSGVIIKCGDKKVKLQETFTFNKPSSEHAESKALYLAIKHIANNEEMKYKKIIIVVDNDSLAPEINNFLNTGRYKPIKFLKDTCDILKNNRLDIHFHSLKSHLKDDKKIDKDVDYDMYYNDQVDDIARNAAGLKSKTHINKYRRRKTAKV